jgi:uroporphyrinogen decarboxylase
MKHMTPKQRVQTAMRHERPDRVPLFYRDIPEVELRLLADLGLQDREELLRHLDIDFRWVAPEYIGPPLEDEQTERRRDIWGVEYYYQKYDETDGYWEPVSRPLAYCEDVAELDAYPWPKLEWFDFSTLTKQIDQCEDYAVMTAPGPASPGILQIPLDNLVGGEQIMLLMASNPQFFDVLVERLMNFWTSFIEQMLTAAGDRIDFFRIGDDYGTQQDLLIGPQMWRERIQPAIRTMYDVAKRHGAWCYQHSCGAVRKLIPDLIDAGIDVLDPIQVKATGMVPAELKAEFGDRLCFSGGVDEQELLVNGSPQDVQASVWRLLDDMARDGGFFLGPTHNFQTVVPTDNILAMYEAGRTWTPTA